MCSASDLKVVHNYRHPPPPPLPLFRVDKAPPFTYTGVDFAGPLYLKGASTSPKVWICLFTCCVTRAVHLDLVQDLSTSSFIRCLKKFVARRGLPTRIVSDNGKTFKSAAKVLRSIVSSDGTPLAWAYSGHSTSQRPLGGVESLNDSFAQPNVAFGRLLARPSLLLMNSSQPSLR